MEVITAKINRMHKNGFSILEIYHELGNKWNLEKITREIVKSEMTLVTEHFEFTETFIIVPSKMNYSFKINKHEYKIQD